MQVRQWVQITFEAGHAPVEHPCPDTSGAHGHRYLVRAFQERKYDPIIQPLVDDLLVAMRLLRQELHGTIIDDMLPGVTTTPAGIAAWLLERLVQCDAVEVRQDEFSSVTLFRKEQHNG